MGLLSSMENLFSYLTVGVIRAVFGPVYPDSEPDQTIPYGKPKLLHVSTFACPRKISTAEVSVDTNASKLVFVKDKPKDFENFEIERNVNAKTDPWFVSQWYELPDGSRYPITIDTNNRKVMNQLEAFSKESIKNPNNIDSVIQMAFGLKSGETLVLNFDRKNPKTLETLVKATKESIGCFYGVQHKIQAKQIFSFVFSDESGRKNVCSLDVNNRRIARKLKMMEKWALQTTKPGDLFDIKMDSSDGATMTFQLDLKNPMTIRNLRALKEESLTGKPARLANPIRKKLKVEEISSPKPKESDLASVELFSPYTGQFTAMFDTSDQQFIAELRKLSEDFRGSLYQYIVTVEDASKEAYDIKLDMANPKVVYTLVTMTQKHSVRVVSFPPSTILKNLFTVMVPEDNSYLTLDVSRHVVYGGLFDLSNSDRKGIEVSIPCKGNLMRVFLDVENPRVVNKLKSFALATIVPKVADRKVSLLTLIFLTVRNGLKPISLDLADRRNIIALCRVTRNNPTGENPTYLEILDDTGQFLTITLDLNNPNIVECLMGLSKPSWFLSINAVNSPYLIVCLPCGKRHTSIKIQLKTSAIDEMSKILDKRCPDYTLLEIYDSRGNCNVIYVDPTLPNLINKLTNISEAVQILPPLTDNALTIYNPISNAFIDLDLYSKQTKDSLWKFEGEYHPTKPLTVVKYRTFEKEVYVFAHVDEEFLAAMERCRADLGSHVVLRNAAVEEGETSAVDWSENSVGLRSTTENTDVTSTEDLDASIVDSVVSKWGSLNEGEKRRVVFK